MAARLRGVGWLMIVAGAVCSATVIFLASGVIALAAGLVCLLLSAVVGSLEPATAPAALAGGVRSPIQVRAATIDSRAALAAPEATIEGIYFDNQGRARCRAGLLMAPRGGSRDGHDAQPRCPLLEYPELDCAQPCFHRSPRAGRPSLDVGAATG